MSMTIQEFSVKTGLPPSTLRYYDRKKLLVPSGRLDNGYRVYTEDQVSNAQMIHSLRQADISMDEINQYLSAPEREKGEWIRKWRQEVETKLSALQIAKQYLGGIHPESRGIHLIKWDTATTMIWFNHTVQRKRQPFTKAAQADRKMVEKKRIQPGRNFFIKTRKADKDTITGEVGFCVNNGLPLPDNDSYYLKTLEPTLFVSIQCSTVNEFICFNLMHLLNKYGFEIKGEEMEQYHSANDTTYQLLIPVMQSPSS